MTDIEKRLAALEADMHKSHDRLAGQIAAMGQLVDKPHERLKALEDEIIGLKREILEGYIKVYEHIHKGFSLVKGELEKLEKKVSQ